MTVSKINGILNIIQFHYIKINYIKQRKGESYEPTTISFINNTNVKNLSFQQYSNKNNKDKNK